MAEPSSLVRPSSSVVPAAEHDILQSAIANFRAVLSDAQRQELQAMERKDGIPDANAILVFTAGLDAINRQRRGRSPSTRLHRFLSAIGEFCSIITDGRPCNIADTYVSSNPEIAALVWGSVKLTMVVLMNFMSFYDGAYNLLMKITDLCPIMSEYHSLYRDSHRLRKSLSAFYASVIRCCQHMIETIQRRGYMQFAKKLVTSFDEEFKPDLENIQSCRKSVKEEVSLAKMRADLQHQQLQANERQKSEHSRASLTQFFSRTENSLHKLEDQQVQSSRQASASRRQQLLDALSTHDFMRPFKQSNEKRYGNTTHWVFETQHFQRWLEGAYHVLWCSGKIGSGKTIVTCSAIQHILNDEGPHGCSVSFFFAQTDDSHSLTAHVILRTILRQRLAGTEISEALEGSIQKIVSSSTFLDLLDLLYKLLPPPQKHYILIDGLDECDTKERKELLKLLSALVSAKDNVRLFLSGRASIQDEVKKRFKALEHLSLDCEATNDDIATYIKGSLEDKLEDGELSIGDPTLLSDIKKALTKGAQGMFLWVFFQLQEICSQHCDEDIRNTLDNLPRDLAETFRRSLRRIEDRKHGPAARKVFPWVVGSKRPLSLEELREAIAIEIGQEYTIRARLYNDMKNIISWCENLVQVDEESQFVQFAHSAVRTYLIEGPTAHDPAGYHLVLKDVDHQLGEICVTYLNFNDFKTTLAVRSNPLSMDPLKATHAVFEPGSRRAAMLSRITQCRARAHDIRPAVEISSQDFRTTSTAFKSGHPFLDYASIYWIWHTTTFREASSQTWILWKSIVTNGHDLAQTPWEGSFSDIYSAANIPYGIDFDDAKMWGWAERTRHRALISLLLNQLQPRQRIKLFQGAVRAGDIQRVIALSHDCSIPLDSVNAALLVASHQGRSTVVQELATAKTGADPQSNGNTGRTRALHAAAASGHIKVVKKLLAANVEVNARTAFGNGTTALQAAVEAGHLTVADLLLKVGAEVNASPACNGSLTALQAAAKAGYLAMVNRLLEAGAEVNGSPAPNGGLTALQAAAQFGNIAVVNRLLEAGAEVNGSLAPNGGLTALQAASRFGHLAIVNRLLEAGAEVDGSPATNGGLTALQAAAQFGHSAVVNRLLAAGADVNGAPAQKVGFTALQAAAKAGHLEIVEQLLAAGAAVNAQSTPPCVDTALTVAAYHGHLEVINRLIDAGADANFEVDNVPGKTALKIAQERRHPEVVNILKHAGGLE